MAVSVLSSFMFAQGMGFSVCYSDFVLHSQQSKYLSNGGEIALAARLLILRRAVAN